MNKFHLSVALDSPIIQSRVFACPQDYVGPTRCAFPKALTVPKRKLRKYKDQLAQAMLRLRHGRTSDNANLHSNMVQGSERLSDPPPPSEIAHETDGAARILTQVNCPHTAPTQCHSTGTIMIARHRSGLVNPHRGKPRNRTLVLVIRCCIHGCVAPLAHVMRSPLLFRLGGAAQHDSLRG